MLFFEVNGRPLVVPTIVFIISYNILKIKQKIKCFTLFHVEHYIVSDEICLRQMNFLKWRIFTVKKQKEQTRMPAPSAWMWV